MTNRERGDQSEAAFILTLVRHGYKVLTPWGQNHRYDVVLDTIDGFKKVQCKTGRLERNGDVIVFNSCSNPYGKKRTNYRGQIDYFGVYCPELNKAYLVPVSVVGVSAGILRLNPTRNGQSKKIRLAKDFEVCTTP